MEKMVWLDIGLLKPFVVKVQVLVIPQAHETYQLGSAPQVFQIWSSVCHYNYYGETCVGPGTKYKKIKLEFSRFLFSYVVFGMFSFVFLISISSLYFR